MKLLFKNKIYYIISFINILLGSLLSAVFLAFDIGKNSYSYHAVYTDFYPLAFFLFPVAVTMFLINKKILDKKVKDILKEDIPFIISNHIFLTIVMLSFLCVDKILYNTDIYYYEKVGIRSVIALNILLLLLFILSFLLTMVFKFVYKHTKDQDSDGKKIKLPALLLLASCVLEVNCMIGEFIRIYIIDLWGKNVDFYITEVVRIIYITPILCALLLIIANIMLNNKRVLNYILYNALFVISNFVVGLSMYSISRIIVHIIAEQKIFLRPDRAFSVDLRYFILLAEFALAFILAIILSILIVVPINLIRKKSMKHIENDSISLQTN